MKHHRTHTLLTVTVGARWFLSIAVIAKAVHYIRAAQEDERNGFRYTAAMEWQLAAGLFGSDTLAAEYFWHQWERIMNLPRHLAEPIVDSQPVLREERVSVRQSVMERSNNEATAA
jgi:hypothetical protein